MVVRSGSVTRTALASVAVGPAMALRAAAHSHPSLGKSRLSLWTTEVWPKPVTGDLRRQASSAIAAAKDASMRMVSTRS